MKVKVIAIFTCLCYHSKRDIVRNCRLVKRGGEGETYANHYGKKGRCRQMRSAKHFLKKSTAVLMAGLLLLTNVGLLGVIADEQHEHAHESNAALSEDGTWTGTVGELIAQNYQLNDYEKAILQSSGLVGATFTVNVPDQDTQDKLGLVTVDSDAKTVAAKPYETEGFVWEPTAAVLKYTNKDGTPGTDLDVPLTKVGDVYVGSFNNPANSYRVEVTYTLSIAVDKATQQLLLNAPYYLAEGAMQMENAMTGSLGLAVETIDGMMESLRELYNGVSYDVVYEGKTVASYKVGLKEDGKVKEALGNLIADFDKNGGKSTLAVDMDAYAAAKSKVQFMLENGNAVKEHIAAFYQQVAAINKNKQELLDLADQLDNIATGTGDGTVAGAKAQIDALVAEAEGLVDGKIQSDIIEPAIKKANDEYGADISSLRGKTRKDDAIYNEIEAKRVEFEKTANDLESSAAYLPSSLAQQAREKANLIRTTGMEALDKLEEAIREAYRLGDEKIAELQAKKDDADAYGALATEKAKQIRDLVGGRTLSGAASTIFEYHDQEWKYLGKTLVKEDITADEYKALDRVVSAAYDAIEKAVYAELHDDMAIQETLFADDTVIAALVEQFVIYVNVEAQAVSKNKVNSADLISMEIVSYNFPMDKDTAVADVLAAIEDCGVENTALAQWDAYYNIGNTHYDRVASFVDMDGNEVKNFKALTSDITYVITYLPKTHTIKQAYGENLDVPYGYNWQLPRHEDETKSYDYEVDGTAYRQNDVVRVLKDIDVTRKEGKALSSKLLPELIAASHAPGMSLTAKEKAVLNSGALAVAEKVFYRMPDNNDKLVKVSAVSGATYQVEAKTMDGGLLGRDTEWIPTVAYPIIDGAKGAAFDLVKDGDRYVGTFDCDVVFTSVQVEYCLAITGLDAALVNELVNIADVLVADTAAQKATLDALCTENNFYNNLGQVTSTILGSIGQLVPNMSAEAKAALSELMAKAINKDSTYTYLYEYLTQYQSENGGLSYYYKGANAANIQQQIALVNELLPIVWKDAAVQQYVDSMAATMAGASERVEAVMDQLAKTDLLPVNALVDTNSPYIDNLLAIVLDEGTTSAHTVDGTVEMQTVLSAAAPGLTTYGVEIQVLNKNDGVVETYRQEAYRAQGKTVTVAEWEALYAELFATIPNNQYYVVNKHLPTQDVVLGENAVMYTSALRPFQYTVKLEGEADQTLYAFDAYTITLPGTGNVGFKYRYNIGGKVVDVTSGALENYSLGTTIDAIAALFGDGRELVITRELIDINKDNLINFVDKFNQALANAGLTANGELAVAFIPMQDKDGNLSIVLRMTSAAKTLSPASLASEMMNLIQDLTYVGLNGSPLFGLNSENELKFHIQTFINTMLNSGFGMDSFAEMVDQNGNLKELSLAGATMVSLNGNYVIPNANQLGAKMAQSTMEYGVNATNATSVPFYVTYQDFDAQADLLRKARKGAQQILPYFNLSFRDGAANMMLNVPDSAYAYLMTALLSVGQVEFDTLQSYDLAAVLKYLIGLIDPMFDTDGVSSASFINTIAETGFYDAIAGFDTDANRALMDFFYDTFDHLFDHIDIDGTSVGGKYSGVHTYDALDMLLNSKISLGEYTNMIAELNSGLSLPVTFELKNRDTRYEALVLDVLADGITNKYHMTRNAAQTLAQMKDGGVAILLSDIRSDVTFNNDVILNLNSYSIDGNLLAKGGVVSIVDSTLDTQNCGSVVGKLSTANGGDFLLGAGKYLSGAEKYLSGGYALESNVVTNGCYTLEKDGDELTLSLGTDYFSLDKSAARIMATDVLFKLLMNYYGVAELVVDGNQLYEVALYNITESLRTPSVLLGKSVECIDCAGATAFATQFMADVTDFGALADTVKTGGVLVSYTLQNAAFNPYMKYENENGDDFFSFNVEACDNKQITKLNVKLADDIPADHQKKISDILYEMDRVVIFNELTVNVEDITYDSNGFSAKGNAAADVTIDLSKDVNYPIILGALLADSASGANRTNIVKAIRYYQTSGSAIQLQKVIETASVADFGAALRATRNKSFASILAGLGLTATDATQLESLYTIARKALGTLLEFADVNGTHHTLSGLKLSGQYATYGYSITRNSDTFAKISLILFAEERAIIVKDKNGNIYVNTDDLAEAFAKAKNGATIYVNKETALTQNVVLPAVKFTLVNAQNVDFGAYRLEFNNGNTALTVDQDISGYVTADSSIFCSDVTMTKDGEWFVFTLDGQRHEWETVAKVEPECDIPGSTEGIWCKHCHQYKEGHEPEEIPALTHHYVVEIIAPTCTEDGYTLHTCTLCGDTYETDPVRATNHEGTTKIVKGYAHTCTEDGLTDGLICTKCGVVLEEQTVIPAQHTPVDYNKTPTCDEPGVSGGSVCDICGEILDEGTEIQPSGHTIVTVPGKEASCTEEGYTSSSYCSVCGAVIKPAEILPKLPHTPVTDPAVKPSCTETGLSEGSHCQVCGEVFVKQDVIPMEAHTPVIDPAVKPSCTETGLTEGSHCQVCGKVLTPQEVVPMAAHTPETIPAVKPSCTATGLSEGSRCQVCGKILVPQQEVPMAEHTPEIDPAVKASCSATGLSEGSHCQVCGKILVAQQVTAKLPHTPVTDPAKPATLTETGLTEGSHCGVCGEVLVAQTVLAKLPGIGTPQVTVDAVGGIIRGAKVDASAKRVSLDVSPSGFTVKEFTDVNFPIQNASESTVTIYPAGETTARAQDDLVCNGDTVSVWATNVDGETATLTYTIVIMGDTDCDGKVNARDLVMMKLAFVGDRDMEGVSLMAADMNHDGKLNARDTVACDTKYVLWDEKGYVSQTK